MGIIFRIILFLRRIFEPLAWELFKQKGWEELEDLAYWGLIKDATPEKFSYTVNKIPYLPDPHSGLLGFSFPVDEPRYFFKKLLKGRDCDDWSRIWVCYYRYHNKPIEEWVVTSKKHPFKNSHFIAVVKDDDGYRLLNYRRSVNVHGSISAVLDELAEWNSCYNKSDRMQCLYKKY